MKKTFFILLFSILVSSACKRKFPDGPLISFRTIDNRVLGTWELENYIVNGTDSASVINNILGEKAEFDFNLTPYNLPYNLKIQWGNDTANQFLCSADYHIKLYYANTQFRFYSPQYKYPSNMFVAIGNPDATPIQILKCEYRTMWLRFQLNNNNYELHLNNLDKK